MAYPAIAEFSGGKGKALSTRRLVHSLPATIGNRQLRLFDNPKRAERSGPCER
jgi:hypothetical protein